MTEFDIEKVLGELPLADKIKILTGLRWWNTVPIPKAGVPSIKLSDGPNGLRGAYFFNGTPSNCFPCGAGLGSSFDIELVRRVGEALGDEAHVKGVHVLLGPTVNIPRSPLGGRNFEFFAEDPHLNGTIAAAYINGVQSRGISATIKHFVANDQEYQRFSISSEVSERALREIYLKPFQIAIKHASPWTLMSAFNRVNGTHVSEDKRILDSILRKEWGFEGMIVSDWSGVYSTTESIKAGLDLEMAGPSVMRGTALRRALNAGKVLPSNINDRARKVLGLVKRGIESGVGFDVEEDFINTPKQREILREAAQDAIVLLKNDRNLLPLSVGIKNIAVIGPNAAVAITSGGGSATLLSLNAVSPLKGIQSVAEKIEARVTYTIGAVTYQRLPLLDSFISHEASGAIVEFWNDKPSKDFMRTAPDFGANLTPPIWTTPTESTECFFMDRIDKKVKIACWIRYSTWFAPDEDGDWELSLTVAKRANLFLDQNLVIDLSTNPQPGSSFFGSGTEYITVTVPNLKARQPHSLEIRLENFEQPNFRFWGGIRLGGARKIDAEAELEHAAKLAKEADVTVLIIGLNNDLESEGSDRSNMDLPGHTDALVSKVLKANPSTVVVNQSGTPVTMPWVSETDTLVQAFYGGDEFGNALADVLFGKVNPSGKLPLTFPRRLEHTPAFPLFGVQEHGKIQYGEGIFVGYRYYDIRGLAPLFPFGFGLSYTMFSYSNLVTSNISEEGTFRVTFTVTNTGNVDGREIVQVYISDQQASLPRPVKELKGFTKVALAAGESKTVTLELDREAFGFYDERDGHWIAEAGEFMVHVAASSSDLRLSGSVELRETLTWTGL